MILDIIMLIGAYPILFIMHFMMKRYRNYNEGLIFGCSLEYEYVKLEEITEIQKSFVKQMNITLLILTVFPLITFFISYMSIQLTIWMVWLLAVMIVSIIPFALAHEKVMKLKKEKGLSGASDTTLITDTKLPGRIKTVKLVDFLIPILASAIACIYAFINAHNTMYGAVYSYSISLSFFCATILFAIAALIVDRKKCDVISRNSDVNLNYNRASKKIWRDLWIALSYVNAIVTAVICFTIKSDDNAFVVILGSIIETIIMIVIVVSVMKKKDSLHRSYSKYMEEDLKRDDDQYWIWGMFYYNPNDKHITIEKRIGIGTTINMATGTGKFTMAFTIIILLSLLPISGFAIREQFTPIHLHVDNKVLICSQTGDKYKLDIDKMSDVKIINKLPDLTRTNGTGMDTLLKGNFSSKEYGKCKLLLNPQNSKFIELKYEGKTYFLSDHDDKGTGQIYNEIKK